VSQHNDSQLIPLFYFPVGRIFSKSGGTKKMNSTRFLVRRRWYPSMLCFKTALSDCHGNLPNPPRGCLERRRAIGTKPALISQLISPNGKWVALTLAKKVVVRASICRTGPPAASYFEASEAVTKRIARPAKMRAPWQQLIGPIASWRASANLKLSILIR